MRAKLIELAGQERLVHVDGTPRKLVYRPIPNSHAKLGAAAIPRVAASGATDLRVFNPYGPLDQGPTGSCWAHATAKGLVIGFGADGLPIPFLPSTRALYTNARAYERVPRPDDTLDPITDSGTIPTVGLAALNAYGVRPSYVPNASDVTLDLSKLNDEPELDDVETEAYFVPVENETILDCSYGRTLEQVEGDLVATLLGGGGQPPTAIGFGTYVSSSFMNWTPGQPPCGAQDPNDPNGGGHAILIVGHRPSASGVGFDFLVDNSWGTSWGAGGAIWVSPAFIAQVTDLVPFRARKAA